MALKIQGQTVIDDDRGLSDISQIGIGTTSNLTGAKLLVDVGSGTTAVTVQGSEGQLFSVTNELTTGSIFSVNDISGIPSIDVDADGTILVAPYSTTEKVGIGTTSPAYKMDVVGDINFTGTLFQNGTEYTSGIASLTNDASPVLGADLDANSNNIFGINNLNVSGVSTFQGNVYLGDNDSLYFGDSNDLQIYHDTSNSVIKDVGAGNLVIAGDNAVDIYNSSVSEVRARFLNNGAVELYYNNSKKFETTGTGVTITGIATATTFYAERGTYAAGNDTATDAAIVIEEEGSIYTRDGVYLRKLIEKKSDIIHIGAQNTSLIDGIHLRPGTWGGSVKLHAGGSTDNVKLQTASDGIQVAGIVTAISGIVTYYGDGQYLTGISAGGGSPWTTTGYTGIGTTSAVGIGTIIEIIPYDTQNSGTLSFEASAGQLFSITNNLTTGSIFSVNDISGIPSIDVDADGTVLVAPYSTTEKVGIGTTNPQYKLHVIGNVEITGTLTNNGSSVGGGGVSDGDKGDITVSNSGATWTIDSDVVTYAKIQNVSATNRILGRDSTGAGVIEEITPANVRTMLNVADGANNYSHPNHSGDVTSSADGATTIANNAVTHAKYQQVATDTIIGRTASGSGDVTALTATEVRGIINVADGATAYSNSDVDSHLNQSNPTSGYVLSWNGTDYAWVSQSGGGGSSTLSGLTDVTISSPSSGQVLKYNGSAWVNDTDATGSGGGGSGTVDLLEVMLFSS